MIAKSKLLRKAFERFRMKADEAEKEAFLVFLCLQNMVTGVCQLSDKDSSEWQGVSR